MAGRNSFVLYVDAGQHIDLLSNEEAGAMVKALFRYAGTGEVPSGLSPAAAMAFSFIRAQIDRDGEKWEQIKQKRSEAGRRGGRPRSQTAQQEANQEEENNEKQIEAKKANAFSEKQEEAKKAVTVPVTVPVTVTVPVINNIYNPVIEHLNSVCGTRFRASSKATQRLIHARVNEGFSLDDFKTVINKKAAEWGKDPKMVKFLRPETLFGTKFESYLNLKSGSAYAPEDPQLDAIF